MKVVRTVNWCGFDVNLIVMGEHVSYRMMMRKCSFADDERIAEDVLDIFEDAVSDENLQELIEDNIQIGGESSLLFKKEGKHMLIPFIFKIDEIVIKTVIIKESMIVKDEVYFEQTAGGWRKNA